jgi:hypothetical protein
VAARLEARRSEGAVRAAMSRWRGGVPAATCGRRRCRRFQVEQEGRSEGGSDASASDGKTRCGRKRAGADWYGPTDDDNILVFLVVG